MSRQLASIDPHVLDAVTGGKSSSTTTSTATSNIDGLMDQLNSITSSIKDITKKTDGLSNSEMFMLCALALQSRPAGVVYVGTRRWW